MSNKIWIAFLDESGKKIEGYFEKVKDTDSFIKIKSGTNLLTIPYNRILKVKENIESSNDNHNYKGGNT